MPTKISSCYLHMLNCKSKIIKATKITMFYEKKSFWIDRCFGSINLLFLAYNISIAWLCYKIR